ncbi:RelA/SpoT domain-containing protein [Clostridium sp. PL3]|uniref:RelA/SpoT domain-containing protein n=1 Tax=Clostridium thailandense TaxID=2794346 RepID=A0A949X4P8_9CLOT|nr:RelA/SpoT domain-containing protein [Clostridium thailandense]MBV7276904.1 RelA/SpoT domain-containing protein [Clostridium thailandense]
MELIKEKFLQKYHISEESIIKNDIDWDTLNEIYIDFNKYRESYDTQAGFIANTLRTHEKIHSVKARVKNTERLIEKIIRKTPDRKEKYGPDFKFTIDNYKDQINDLIGVRVIHIFKEDWEDIHNFILQTWNVIEITANVREGDDTKRFEELNIEIKSRKSGYRSVHYLIEFFPTNQRVITEIQVRTIFEEGYGEIDHQLRYSHSQIPEVLEMNLLLFNRIAGSSDEMASLINLLNKKWTEMEEKYENIIEKKNEQIKELIKKIEEKEELMENDRTE